MDHPRELTVEAPRAWDRPVVSVPVLVCLSLVGGQLPSFSAQANLYTLGTGGALIWLGLSNRVPRRPAPRRLAPGAVWWLLPVTVFGVFEGATFVLGDRRRLPHLLPAGGSAAGGPPGPLRGLVRLAGRVLGAGAAMMRALAIGGFLAALRALRARSSGRPGGRAPGSRRSATSAPS